MTVTIDRLLPLRVALVARTPSGDVDENGDIIQDEARTEDVRCELQQGGAHEEEGGAIQVNTWRAWLPASVADLTGWDAIELEDGTLLELEGNPWPVRNPRTGDVHHVEARVRSVT